MQTVLLLDQPVEAGDGLQVDEPLGVVGVYVVFERPEEIRTPGEQARAGRAGGGERRCFVQGMGVDVGEVAHLGHAAPPSLEGTSGGVGAGISPTTSVMPQALAVHEAASISARRTAVKRSA